MTPLFAALSNAVVTARRASVASLFLPVLSNARYFFSSECKRDFRLRLRNRFRALFRMRRSADLVFGIISSFRFRARNGSRTAADVNGEEWSDEDWPQRH